jgi:hypothetical protein
MYFKNVGREEFGTRLAYDLFKAFPELKCGKTIEVFNSVLLADDIDNVMGCFRQGPVTLFAFSK